MIKHLQCLFCILCVIYSVRSLGDDFDVAKVDWKKNDPTSTITIDHQIWDNFLNRYIHSREGINLLDYKGVSKQSKKQLNAYIKQLTEIKISQYNRNEQQAYWINLYNALTVRLILNAYPVDSIKSVKLMKFSFKEFSPWDRELVTINQVNFTLNNIEHKILRKHWSEPRIHYAINCASISCPNLANRAYTAKDIDIQLDHAAKAYINHLRAVQLSTPTTLLLSSIYQWYGDDFGGGKKAIISHLIKYAEQPLAKKLEGFSGNIKYQYNWKLNNWVTIQ